MLGTKITKPVTKPVAQPPVLPMTGSDTQSLVLIALELLVAGVALAGVGRRRSPSIVKGT